MRNLLFLLPFVLLYGLWHAGYIHGQPDINDAVMAKSIDAKTQEPKEKAETFRVGDPIYVCVQGSSLVKGKSVLTIRWMLGNTVLQEQTVKADRDGKYWMAFLGPIDKINGGNLKVDILVDGSVKMQVAFRANPR